MLLLHCYFRFCFSSGGKANANSHSQRIAVSSAWSNPLFQEVNVSIIYSLTVYFQFQDSSLAKQQNKLDRSWVFLRSRGCSQLLTATEGKLLCSSHGEAQTASNWYHRNTFIFLFVWCFVVLGFLFFFFLSLVWKDTQCWITSSLMHPVHCNNSS